MQFRSMVANDHPAEILLTLTVFIWMTVLIQRKWTPWHRDGLFADHLALPIRWKRFSTAASILLSKFPCSCSSQAQAYKMQITIRTLSKIEFTVTAEPADTVNQLKHKIAAATVDRFASRLLLTHNRHTLGDGSQSIDQYNVTEGSKITVVFRSGQVPVSAQLPVTPGGLAFQQER